MRSGTRNQCSSRSNGVMCPATAAGDARVHCTRPVSDKQPRLEPGQLPCLGSHSGTSLQDSSAWHSWPHAAPHWDLVGHSADCNRRSHWRVGATTTSLRLSKGTSLRTLAVTQSHPNFIKENSYAFVCLNISNILLTHKYCQHTQSNA